MDTTSLELELELHGTEFTRGVYEPLIVLNGREGRVRSFFACVTTTYDDDPRTECAIVCGFPKTKSARYVYALFQPTITIKDVTSIDVYAYSPGSANVPKLVRRVEFGRGVTETRYLMVRKSVNGATLYQV